MDSSRVFHECTGEQNQVVLRHPIIHFPTSLGDGSEWVSEQAKEWAQRSARAKRVVWNNNYLISTYGKICSCRYLRQIWHQHVFPLLTPDEEKKKVFPSSSRRQFWNRCYRCHSLLSPAVIYLSAVSISRKRKMQKYVTFDSRNMLTIENIEIEKVLWYTRGTGTPIYWLIFTGWLVFRKDWTCARRLISNQ